MKKIFLQAAFALALLSSCSTQPSNNGNLTLSNMDPAKFEATFDGKPVKLYTLTNENGMEVCVTSFGARLVSIMVPAKDGKMTDVLLGFDNVQDYKNIPNDFGATIGRYANRIGDGKLTIDGQTYQLPQNNGTHCLHGGPKGWQNLPWDAKQIDNKTLKLTILSPDGDSNFPGAVTASVTYTLTNDNAIKIDYEATTDKKTVINMTNHSYFNLNGNPAKEAMDHTLYIAGDNITPIDETFATTGEYMAVAGTPFDFNTPKVLSKDINAENDQIKYGIGFDHNWVLTTNGDINKLAAKLTGPETGITLEVYTDEPGCQLYTGNFLDGTVKGKKGIIYNKRASVCLETQKYPDTPNKPHWPSAIVEPGKPYSSHTIFKFGVEK